MPVPQNFSHEKSAQTKVERYKFQNLTEESPYEAGQIAGMQMDTIPEALEKLHLHFTRNQVTISPWLIPGNTVDAYVVDERGNFFRPLSDNEKAEFEKGIRDWLRGSRGVATRQVWPQTETGTCYEDAWRFVIKEQEGELVHGSLFSGGRRINHGWVETATRWVWEPETGQFFPLGTFRYSFAPVVEARYTPEQAAIMAARTRNFGPWSEEERQQFLPSTETLSAVDYWNKYLEHNPLRVKVAETSAGATVSWIFEAAGDILREMHDKNPAAGYIAEKVRRIEKEIPVRTWTEPLSERDKALIEEVKIRLEGLPEPDPLHANLKLLMRSILNRDQSAMKLTLDGVKFRLEKAHLLGKYSPMPTPKIFAKYPTGSITITQGAATLTGRFERKDEMVPGQVEPNIIVTILERGSEEDELAAMKKLEDTLRANVREVEDSEQLEEVEPTVREPPPQENTKYPRVLSMDDFKRDWEPKGWKIIFIGPTSTWREEWGVWEAIRDLVQNALDETESYQWGYDNEGFWISDTGKGVAVADFLLGPPKIKPDYARGRFGEGMKIASLALLRSGYQVHVETVGREIWMIFIEQEANGKFQSLAAMWKPGGTSRGTKFRILGYFGNSYDDRFAVNLPGVAVIAQAPAVVVKPVQRYNQLIQHEFKDGNRIYARDIYMRPIRSVFSYNLWGFEMAPDRFGPKKEDDVWIDMGRLWCCVKDVKLLEIFLQMKSDPPLLETDETNKLSMGDLHMGINPETNDRYRTEIQKNKGAWLEAWLNTFGEDAVIRTNADWDAIIKHLGYRSVSMSYGVTSALMHVIPWDRQIIDQSQERLRGVEVVPDNKLSDRQLAHLALARDIADKVTYGTPSGGVRAAIIPPASDRVRTAGMYGRNTLEIFIHVEQLFRARSTVDTVIHEIAHHTSGAEDGEDAHNREMTRIAGDVVSLAASGAFDDLIKAPGFLW